MAEESTSKPGTAFWIIGGLLAVWNLSGLYQYFLMSTITPAELEDAGYTLAQVAYITGTPAWAHAGYAIAVNAGVLGAILLLLRKYWAFPLFVLSLLGALVQDLDAFILRDAIQAWGQGGIILPVAVIVICIFEIWYTRNARNKGWLS